MSKMTVAMVAFDRADYLERAQDALVACQGFGSGIVDQVIVSVDDGGGRGNACLRMSDQWTRGLPVARAWAIGQPNRRGIVGNSILALKMAFDSGAENVLYLEDDAVLKPDALRLAAWFFRENFGYVALGLSAHAEKKPSDPAGLQEMNYMPCPFAYVVNQAMWPFILRNWCRKNYHPCGWSWSMTYAAREAGYKFLAPFLSRVENIGRERGTNETPENWEQTQVGIEFSDGSYRGEYDVSHMISDRVARRVDPWMEAELQCDPSKRYDGWLGFGRPAELG